jgi:hypothetical protein
LLGDASAFSREAPVTAFAPMLKAAGLWRKTSSKGNQYFVGRLGGVKILILENRDAGKDKEPDLHLFFVEVENKAAAPAQPQAHPEPPQRAMPRRAYPARRAARPAAHPPIRPAADGMMPDDPVDDIGRR